MLRRACRGLPRSKKQARQGSKARTRSRTQTRGKKNLKERRMEVHVVGVTMGLPSLCAKVQFVLSPSLPHSLPFLSFAYTCLRSHRPRERLCGHRGRCWPAAAPSMQLECSVVALFQPHSSTPSSRNHDSQPHDCRTKRRSYNDQCHQRSRHPPCCRTERFRMVFESPEKRRQATFLLLASTLIPDLDLSEIISPASRA